MLLIYDAEEEWGNLTEAQRRRIVNDFMQLRQRLKSAGNYLGGAQLRTTESATSLRIRNGKRLLTDGPFAETHEQLCGYYIIEAEHLDEALDIAAQIPSARLGTVEVRPIVESTLAI